MTNRPINNTTNRVKQVHIYCTVLRTTLCVSSTSYALMFQVQRRQVTCYCLAIKYG